VWVVLLVMAHTDPDDVIDLLDSVGAALPRCMYGDMVVRGSAPCTFCSEVIIIDLRAYVLDIVTGTN